MDAKEIVNLEKGELDLNLKFEDGKLKLSFGYDGKGADAGIYVDLDSDYFLDKLADAIPGELDDTVINLIKAAL